LEVNPYQKGGGGGVAEIKLKTLGLCTRVPKDWR